MLKPSEPSRWTPSESERAAALAAVVVFLVGFGAMAAMSANGSWDIGRDMWHYRAATWGDAIVVPGISAILAAGFWDRRIPRQAHERIWVLRGGGAFALAGALVQASWLASSQPILNWTLPEPHRFSFPGWYHAVFLVLLSGAIGAAGFVLARRVRSAPAAVRDYVSRSPATAALTGFSVSFGLLLYFDSVDSLDTSAGQGSAAGAVGTVFAAVLLLFFVLGPRRSLRPLAGGSLVVLALLVGVALTHGLP